MPIYCSEAHTPRAKTVTDRTLPHFYLTCGVQKQSCSAVTVHEDFISKRRIGRWKFAPGAILDRSSSARQDQIGRIPLESRVEMTFGVRVPFVQKLAVFLVRRGIVSSDDLLFAGYSWQVSHQGDRRWATLAWSYLGWRRFPADLSLRARFDLE
jgi:hypothetical protein